MYVHNLKYGVVLPLNKGYIMKRWFIVLFGVIIVTLGFVGCGSGTSASNTTQQKNLKVPTPNGLPPVPQMPESEGNWVKL